MSDENNINDETVLTEEEKIKLKRKKENEKEDIIIICIFGALFLIGVVIGILVTINILPYREKFMQAVNELFAPEEEITTDVNEYNNVVRIDYDNYDTKYCKWGMSEEIMPEKISDLNVLEFYMHYYNPFDKQFLCYLTIDYCDDEEKYNNEIKRLNEIGIDNYKGIYSSQGFNEDYKLLAMNSDEYQGMIYAIEKNNERKITYVELVFCNYFYDLDYKNLINNDYLPVGFDATLDNEYGKKQMSKY